MVSTAGSRFSLAASYKRSSNPCTTPVVHHTSQSNLAAHPPRSRSFPVLPSGTMWFRWRHPPYSSDSRVAPVPQTTHENCRPTAPSRQRAASAHGASGGPSVSAYRSTIPPPASNVATSPRSLPAHPLRPNIPLPAWGQTALVLFRNTSPESAAAPSAGTSLASPDSNFCLHCDAGALWLLLHDSASTASSPPDSSLPVPSPRLSVIVPGTSLAL